MSCIKQVHYCDSSKGYQAGPTSNVRSLCLTKEIGEQVVFNQRDWGASCVEQTCIDESFLDTSDVDMLCLNKKLPMQIEDKQINQRCDCFYCRCTVYMLFF